MVRPRHVHLDDGRTVRLRRAKPSDAAGMIAHGNAVGAEGIYIMTERVRRTVPEEQAAIRNARGEKGLWLVAESGGKIVGSADVSRGRHRKSRHVGELGIALRKEWRGVGLGRAMMEAMIEWACSARLRKLFLEVFSTNTRAIRLYRGLGFIEEGRLKGQVVLRGKEADVLVMSLWLPPRRAGI